MSIYVRTPDVQITIPAVFAERLGSYPMHGSYREEYHLLNSIGKLVAAVVYSTNPEEIDIYLADCYGRIGVDKAAAPDIILFGEVANEVHKQILNLMGYRV